MKLDSIFKTGIGFIIAGIAVHGLPSALDARASQSASSKPGVYTAAQEKRGAAVYNRECSTCHGETLKGGEGAPPLVGPTFTVNYKGQTVADLFTRIRDTMPAPPEQPGKLSAQQYADVVAHILGANGLPPGNAELPSDVEQLKRLPIEFAR
jgi:mono/diheme cytochrome c family protein